LARLILLSAEPLLRLLQQLVRGLQLIEQLLPLSLPARLLAREFLLELKDRDLLLELCDALGKLQQLIAHRSIGRLDRGLQLSFAAQRFLTLVQGNPAGVQSSLRGATNPRLLCLLSSNIGRGRTPTLKPKRKTAKRSKCRAEALADLAPPERALQRAAQAARAARD
jgi:hypothetical protein